MKEHWIDEHKGEAKRSFDGARRNRINMCSEKPPIRPPQPELTPNGELRRAADRKAREDFEARRAEIERKRQEIQQKFEWDRFKEKLRELGRS